MDFQFTAGFCIVLYCIDEDGRKNMDCSREGDSIRGNQRSLFDEKTWGKGGRWGLYTADNDGNGDKTRQVQHFGT